MAVLANQGAPVVVVAAGGLPIINVAGAAPMTVGDNLMGTAITIVTANGTPATLLKPDGTSYP